MPRVAVPVASDWRREDNRMISNEHRRWIAGLMPSCEASNSSSSTDCCWEFDRCPCRVRTWRRFDPSIALSDEPYLIDLHGSTRGTIRAETNCCANILGIPARGRERPQIVRRTSDRHRLERVQRWHCSPAVNRTRRHSVCRSPGVQGLECTICSLDLLIRMKTR
jgi:hypothetical protein